MPEALNVARWAAEQCVDLVAFHRMFRFRRPGRSRRLRPNTKILSEQLARGDGQRGPLGDLVRNRSSEFQGEFHRVEQKLPVQKNVRAALNEESRRVPL